MHSNQHVELEKKPIVINTQSNFISLFSVISYLNFIGISFQNAISNKDLNSFFFSNNFYLIHSPDKERRQIDNQQQQQHFI